LPTFRAVRQTCQLEPPIGVGLESLSVHSVASILIRQRDGYADCWIAARHANAGAPAQHHSLGQRSSETGAIERRCRLSFFAKWLLAMHRLDRADRNSHIGRNSPWMSDFDVRDEPLRQAWQLELPLLVGRRFGIQPRDDLWSIERFRVINRGE